MGSDLTSIVLAAIATLSAVTLMWSVRGLPASSARPPTRLVIVVPARNEALRLPRLLASIANQTDAVHRVVVVDDMSTDGTDAIARAAGATVVASGGPPAGWTGKTWACHLGIAAAVEGGAEMLVVLDADVWLEPDAITRLGSAHASTTPGGLLSVQPFHVTGGAVEQLSAVPNIVAVMASGLAAIRPFRPSKVAFGPCLVTTPDALAAVGGFGAVRSEAIEDIALAQRFRHDGRPVRCFAGRDVVRFRMYEAGVGALVDGWAKNLAGGPLRAAVLPTLGAVAWVAGAAAVSFSALATPSLLGVALWLVLVAQTAWMLRRLGRFDAWTSIVFPIPVACFIAIFAVSVFRRVVRRSVVWSGRSIPVSGR